MFRKISIVRLVENDPLFTFSLDWPSRLSHQVKVKGNIDLLRYANIISGNLAGLLADQKKGTLLVPIHQSQDKSHWVADLSKKQYEVLTKAIQDMFPEVVSCPSNQCWYWDKIHTLNDLQDRYGIDTQLEIAKSLQELEMMLYAHPVNQSRKKYKQANITGIMLGNIEKSGRIKRKIVGDSELLSLFGQKSLDDWLESPSVNCSLVLGKETGDYRWQNLKEILMLMMENGKLDLVEVISSTRHDIYSGSWFYNLYTKFRAILSQNKQYS